MEGLLGMVGMLLLAIMFIFIPVCFLNRKLRAIKKVVFKKITDETLACHFNI